MDPADGARARLVASGQVPAAVAHLTEDLFVRLAVEVVGPAKALLKQFFSDRAWTAEQAEELSALVTGASDDSTGWWEHELEGGFVLSHGFREGTYHIDVSGGAETGRRGSPFQRTFAGPVVPEATPNPRHVMFHLGGPAGPSRWYGRGEEPGDRRVAALLANEDVSDVLVAPNFVTVGLRRAASWEDKLDEMLDVVAELFWPPGDGREGGPRTFTSRAEMMEEAGSSPARTVEELHLLDPDEPSHRRRLEAGLRHEDGRVRRVAVAILAQASDRPAARAVLGRMAVDPSRLVRRTVIDCAVDAEEAELRGLLEEALSDADHWVRWKAVRGLRSLGVGSSAGALVALRGDPDFQVRFEVAAALRDEPGLPT